MCVLFVCLFVCLLVCFFLCAIFHSRERLSSIVLFLKDPVLPIMLHAPPLLFWFSRERGVY